jgi:hypothetical protein
MQETLDRGEAWWRKYFKWERNLIVAGRTIERGWVVPQPLGIALLLIILGGVGSLYWRLTDKTAEQAMQQHELREMIIRMDQRLMDKQASDEKEQRDGKNKDDLQDLQIKDVNEKLLVLNAKKGR